MDRVAQRSAQHKQYRLTLLGKTYSGITYDDLVCLNYLLSPSKKRSIYSERYISTLSSEARAFYNNVRKVKTSNLVPHRRLKRGVYRPNNFTQFRDIRRQIAFTLRQAEEVRCAKEDYNSILDRLLPVE